MGRSGGGGKSGGKDAFHQPPIDKYRKEIGKQDWKKERRHQRRIVHEAESKDNAPKALKQSVRQISNN